MRGFCCPGMAKGAARGPCQGLPKALCKALRAQCLRRGAGSPYEGLQPLALWHACAPRTSAGFAAGLQQALAGTMPLQPPMRRAYRTPVEQPRWGGCGGESLGGPRHSGLQEPGLATAVGLPVHVGAAGERAMLAS